VKKTVAPQSPKHDLKSEVFMSFSCSLLYSKHLLSCFFYFSEILFWVVNLALINAKWQN